MAKERHLAVLLQSVGRSQACPLQGCHQRQSLGAPLSLPPSSSSWGTYALFMKEDLIRWRERERERYVLQSTHIYLWGHSSHCRPIGRGVPGVSFCVLLVYNLLCLASPQGK